MRLEFPIAHGLSNAWPIMLPDVTRTEVKADRELFRIYFYCKEEI